MAGFQVGPIIPGPCIHRIGLDHRIGPDIGLLADF